MSASVDNKTLLIWDGVEQPPDGCWSVVLWRSFRDDGKESVHSMPRRVEENADILRKRFLGWIYDLGEAGINGRRLVDHLSLRPGFSYWWMTSLAEKSYGKSVGLCDAVKLIELENFVGAKAPQKVILASPSKILARAVRSWCCNSGFKFEWKRLKGKTEKIPLAKRVFRGLPYPLQAVAHLVRYVVERWTLRQKRIAASSAAEITFVDYLAHLNPDALKQGRYESNYWTELIEILNQKGVRTNWLHHYVRHDAVCSAREARNLMARFNNEVKAAQFHVSFDAALCWPVIRSAVRDFCRLVLAGLRLRKVRDHFKLKGSHLDFWPLFERDWRDSLYGATAITNCLFLNLFERLLNALQYQKQGVYLQENQGWEMAFIYAWKAAGHGRLIGVPHATMRYWDLRYFFDGRTYRAGKENNRPLPDLLAVNGPASLAASQLAGIPDERIVEVEALRYLYLSDLITETDSKKQTSVDKFRVLVFGDYVPSVTERQVQLLAEAAASLPSNVEFIMKPHPACSLKTNDYSSLKMSVTNSSLADLLNECDAVFAGHITSAAVDAYVAGLPVISMLDGDMFNMSPLRGLAGVMFVTNPYELTQSLCTAAEGWGGAADAYFCLDRRLNRWQRLLQIDECAGAQDWEGQGLKSDNRFGAIYEKDIQQRI